jgi:hypothetical protein
MGACFTASAEFYHAGQNRVKEMMKKDKGGRAKGK